MSNLEPALLKLYSHIKDADKKNVAVSEANVGWHIEHSLLVISKIIEKVSNSDPSKYKYKFDINRTLVFLLGKFPRGKVKAPDIVLPKQNQPIEYDTVFANVRLAIQELEKAKPNQYFVHPIFGKLNKKHSFVMLAIHTKHHLKIIEDIIMKSE